MTLKEFEEQKVNRGRGVKNYQLWRIIIRDVGPAMPLHSAKNGITGGTGHHSVEGHWDHEKYIRVGWGIGHGHETSRYCSGVPERAIMESLSLGVIFKGWGDGEARAQPLPLPAVR